MSKRKGGVRARNSTYLERFIEKQIRKLEKFDDIYKAEEFIRSLPLSLSEKRKILNTNDRLKKLKENEEHYSTSYHLRKPFDVLLENMKKFKNLVLSPLNYRIQSIENNLGLDVASYFHYTSWLITNNLFTFFFILMPFLCIPHIILLVDNFKIKNEISTNSELNHSIAYNSCIFESSIKQFRAIDILSAEV
jgi:hypothetical protein